MGFPGSSRSFRQCPSPALAKVRYHSLRLALTFPAGGDVPALILPAGEIIDLVSVRG